jgi:hypothetical protein
MEGHVILRWSGGIVSLLFDIVVLLYKKYLGIRKKIVVVANKTITK